MPIRRSRSYYMRSRATLSTPPICRSKATTVCNLQYTLCAAGSGLQQLYRYGLTLPQAQALQASVRPSRGSIWYQDKTNGIAYQDLWDDCITPPATLQTAFLSEPHNNRPLGYVADGLVASRPWTMGFRSSSFQGVGWLPHVPATATIAGMQLRLLRAITGHPSEIHDPLLRITYGGSAHLIPPVSPQPWSTALTWVSYGSPTDQWGTVLTPALINASDFLLEVISQADPLVGPGWAETVQLDSHELIIYFA